MDFPITELMDEDACYAKLVEWLHPDGFACARCGRDDRMASTAAGVPRSWTTAAVTAGGCSTPSPPPPCTASSGDPASWS